MASKVLGVDFSIGLSLCRETKRTPMVLGDQPISKDTLRMGRDQGPRGEVDASSIQRAELMRMLMPEVQLLLVHWTRQRNGHQVLWRFRMQTLHGLGLTTGKHHSTCRTRYPFGSVG